MKTILITGGTMGIGKGIAMSLLKQGNRVLVVSNSKKSGDLFIQETKKSGLVENAVFIQANLSLISENNRLLEFVKNNFARLDGLIFCATKHNKTYIETSEGLEFSFALDYLSRFILSYGWKEWLEKNNNPFILNICGTGLKGNVNWEDMQHKNSFVPLKVMMHASRLNDLSGVQFAKNDTVGKIKYILYNPMAVNTPGMGDTGNLLFDLIFKLMAKPVEKAIIPILELLENLPAGYLNSYTRRKQNSLKKETFDEKKAERLYSITKRLLNGI
ncbi:SDR family NAD(P)-dependent oxidoreductase [Sphingobacterium sp. Mn56C]|uniref:SDR family NAD(P)-dependent oxidoreductase n=1 Tax=Sphingobacterium sp. Mn56C TaxID=3395261 RepID=UPI003BE794F2